MMEISFSSLLGPSVPKLFISQMQTLIFLRNSLHESPDDSEPNITMALLDAADLNPLHLAPTRMLNEGIAELRSYNALIERRYRNP
jgi:hypothetical protein